MSEPLANSPEACIEKFMRTIEEIQKQPAGYYGNPDFERGIAFVSGIAHTWFCDKRVKEVEQCAD